VATAKTYLAVDLHLGYDWTPGQEQNIWDFLKMVHPDDKVIFPGDTLELAWRREEEVYKLPEYHQFITSPGDFIILEGNHDLQKGLPFMLIGDIFICHGHQFDVLADTAWKRFFYRFAPYVRNLWWQSPFEQKMTNNRNWQVHNAVIWARAISWLEASPFRTLVMGHCHDSCIIERPELGKRLVALGSLAEDGVYGEIVDGLIIIRTVRKLLSYLI